MDTDHSTSDLDSHSSTRPEQPARILTSDANLILPLSTTTPAPSTTTAAESVAAATATPAANPLLMQAIIPDGPDIMPHYKPNGQPDFTKRWTKVCTSALCSHPSIFVGI
jgi:hypothetical protein